MIRFRCPHCNARMEVDESFASRLARCATCGTDLKVPQAEESDTSVTPLLAVGPSGPTTVRIGDETVEVTPPLETMAVVSLVLLGTSVAAVFAIGLGRFVTFPWTIGLVIGAGLALLGAMTAVPAYHTIRRSRGRKRGRNLALVGMLGGAALFLGFGAGAVAGIVQVVLRTSCEDNLHKIYDALRAYASRHEGRLPTSLDVFAREGYLADAATLTCPDYAVTVGTPTYQMYVAEGIGVNLDSPAFPADLMIVSDGPPYGAHRDGQVRALLLDGKVIKVPQDQWERFVRDQGRLWNLVREALKAAPPKAETPPKDAEGTQP